jgi:PAS domain S-box-containing protein
LSDRGVPEEDLEDLFENAPCGYVSARPDGRITKANRTLAAWLGRDQGQLVGRRLQDLLNVAGKIYHETHIAPLLRMQGFFDEIALDFVRADGSLLPALVNAAERRDASGRVRCIRVAVFKAPDRRRYERELLEARRASERAHAELRESEARFRELQAKLLHVSRLSAAGEMAAALAHELNQPLTAVAGAVRAAWRMLAASAPDRPPPPAEVREALDLAAEQSLRAGQIIKRLRGLVAKGEAQELRGEDLPRLVEEAAALALAGGKANGVAIAFRLDPALPPVLVDRIQIEQVLVNLVRNAFEAMSDDAGDGGGTARRELVVAATPAGPGSVVVSVADTGPGLAPEVAGRPFEPFASTKPEGMGVGLAICRTIVEAHGGRIWAESNPSGTVFRFTLPATGASGSSHQRPASGHDLKLSGGRTVSARPQPLQSRHNLPLPK